MAWLEKHGDHFYRFVYAKGRGRQEHRILMEEVLNRSLIPFKEVVHHKDGNTLNNDISNLEVLSQHEHIRFHYKRERWNPWAATKNEIDLMKWMKHVGFTYKKMEKMFPYGHSSIWRYVSGKGREYNAA